MKRTGKLLLVATAAMLATSALADDEVIVVTTTGEKAYAIDQVQRIDFTGDALNVVLVDGDGTTYAFDEVQKIVFSAVATAITKPTALTQERLTLTISADGSWLRVNGWNTDQTATLQLYATSGATVAQQAQWNGESVDISALPHGVYILKIGSHTAKFRK